MRNLKEHYAINAAKGRHVRFAMRLDQTHVPEDVAKAAGVGRIAIEIKGGTLTPDQAKRIMAIINESV